MVRHMYQGLRKRTKPKAVLLGTAVLLATALLVVVYVSFLNYRSQLVERLSVAADLRLQAVQTALAEAEADAQIFAKAFGELHGEDAISSEMQAFAELFLAQYQHYFQARILDSSGQEIRKWTWDGANVKVSDALQDKSGRYYYWEGLKLAPGQSYLSRVDYNQEQGALELPLRPTVRSVARFDYTDHGHGHDRDQAYIAVLNMDLSSVLASIRADDTSVWAEHFEYVAPLNEPIPGLGAPPKLVRMKSSERAGAELKNVLPLHHKDKLDPGLLQAPGEQVLAGGGNGLFLAKTVILGESSNMLGVRVWAPPGLVPTQFLQQSMGLLLALLTIFVSVLALLAVQQRKNALLAAQETTLTDQVEQLENSSKKLNEQSERQKQMFAVIGHELRTPVASISMLLDDAELSSEYKLSSTREISQNLLNVLEDLRVVVAPDRALEAKWQTEEPARLIERAINPLKPLMQSQGFSLEFSVQASGQYEFHAQALRQILTNLVKNAAVHSDGARIAVRFFVEESAAEIFGQLVVEDDGVGIPAHKLSQLMQPFEAGQESMGSGLGLYITSELARVAKGDLVYSESSLGGACFTYTFVMNPVVCQKVVQTHEVSSLQGLQILLAEDDVLIGTLSQKQLGAAGAQVTWAKNGKEALEAFQQGSFNVVVTDLMMPEFDGLGLIKALRADVGCDLPVIAVTAAVIGEETDELIRSGASDVISKPISVDKLSESLAKHQKRKVG